MCKTNDAAPDLGILRVTKVPDRHGRVGRQDKEQVGSLKLAPTAGITIIPKFHKIHRTLVFAQPHIFGDLILLGIDLLRRDGTYLCGSCSR